MDLLVSVPHAEVIGKKFAVYRIEIGSRKTQWSLLKRYNEIKVLRQIVVDIVGDTLLLPQFPSKYFGFGNLSSKLIEARRETLATFLSSVMAQANSNIELEKAVSEWFEIYNVHRYARHGDLMALKTLASRCDMNFPDTCKATALHYAVAFGHIECVKFLIGCSPRNSDPANDSTDAFGLTPWTLATLLRRSDCVELLSEESVDISLEPDTFIPVQYRKLDADKHALVLVNPFGGVGKGLFIYEQTVKRVFDQLGLKHTLIVTERKGHAADIAEHVDIDQYDSIITVSGDGLLYEVVNSLLKREDAEKSRHIAVGIIPAGSGNGLAHSIRTPTAFFAARALVSALSTPLDIVECWQPHDNVRSYSFLSQSWGIVADVDFQSEPYRWMGDFRFTFTAALKILKGFEYECRMAYTTDCAATEPEVDENGNFLLSGEWVEIPRDHLSCLIGCNISTLSADMVAAPYATTNDGEIHLIWARSLTKKEMVDLFTMFEDGSHMKVVNDSNRFTKDGAGVFYERATRFVVEPVTTTTCFDLDGERFPNQPTSFTMKPSYAALLR